MTIEKHLEDRIKLLMQINDTIAITTSEAGRKLLEKARMTIAGAIYELAVLKSEEAYGT